jgi:hypothetical protein
MYKRTWILTKGENMRTLSLALITLLSLSNSYGNISERMSCVVGEGSCDTSSCYEKIKVSPSEISFTLQPILEEVLMQPTVAKAVKGFDRYELTNKSFNASWDGGEHWLSMTSNNGYKYKGVLTLEQDYEMEIVCTKKSVVLE